MKAKTNHPNRSSAPVSGTPSQSGEMPETTGLVLRPESLEGEDLRGLLDHSVDAVVVSNYFSRDACENIAERVKKSKYFGAYPDYPSVGRLGQELFECTDEESLRVYQRDALEMIREMRRQVHPFISPVDRLRVELDDVWPRGCRLASLADKKMAVGVIREYQESSDAQPHCDVISWDVLESEKKNTNITNQIAANVILKMSDSGGEILLWDQWPTQAEYQTAHNAAGIGLDSAKISEPKLQLVPQQGDLILFNSMRIHAVKKIGNGIRMTWAFFIGSSGVEDPLVVWS